MLRKYFIIFFSLIMILITLAISVYGLRINEIMFNPQGADTGREWIEVYIDYMDASSANDLSRYKLFENGVNHNIIRYNDTLNNISENVSDSEYDTSHNISQKYAIICNDCEKFLIDYAYLNNTPITLYKSTFSLSNDGENLSIKLANETIDELDYSIYKGEFSEGYSLEFVNNSWHKSAMTGGSPGEENAVAYHR